MENSETGAASAEIPSNRQRVFLRYLIAIFVDLIVLGLFHQYWQHVVVETFTIALAAAVLLQLLLRGTLRVERAVAEYFHARSGAAAKALRYFSAWLILFGSKFVMLGLLDYAFGDGVAFGGPLHGVAAFIVVVVTMLIAEDAVARLYRWLGRLDEARLPPATVA